MNKQRQKLSYARLVSRTDFYKNKALDLEQKIVFAKEKIQTLEEREENRKAEFEELKTRFENLQADYKQLQENGSSEEIDRLVQQLKEKSDMIETLDETISELNQKQKSHDPEKIEQFERLLAEMQTELNEKEQQVQTYKDRMKSLEKRLSSRQSTPVHKVFSEMDGVTKTDKRAIAYFDYSVVISGQKESVIRGNFHIENVGAKPLGTPLVCFRFYPIDASALKGKIISLEQAERNGGESQRMQWVYVDDDWGKKAQERGEIWVRPYAEVHVEPGEKVMLEDFQIQIKKHFDENVVVEGFIYFGDSQYKVKAANQILITF
jgi:hypothetical protein